MNVPLLVKVTPEEKPKPVPPALAVASVVVPLFVRFDASVFKLLELSALMASTPPLGTVRLPVPPPSVPLDQVSP